MAIIPEPSLFSLGPNMLERVEGAARMTSRVEYMPPEQFERYAPVVGHERRTDYAVRPAPWKLWLPCQHPELLFILFPRSHC